MRIRPQPESLSRGLRALAATLAAALACAAASAGAPSNAPQVLMVVTNSQSMDGTTNGAIMTGSGNLSSGLVSLYNSSSPVSYTIPSGFTPPVNPGSGGTANYTTACGSYYCDNGPSRMNMTKAAIQNALNQYGSYLNFGLYTYSTSSVGVYNTWVYYMSPTGGFGFTNTASTTGGTVVNPCYNYTASTTSSTVKSDCSSIATNHYSSIGIANYQYMTVSITSDNPTVNDVFYDSNADHSVMLDYSGPSPATPYPPNQSLTSYENGSVNESYNSSLPNGSISSTGPTNAGYVPYSPEVMYVQRGFGYYAGGFSSTTGSTVVAMNSAVSAFTAALQPETNSASTAEIKSSAVQSPTGGVLSGALNYLNGLTKQSCQPQYVILLTDGLPTRDLSGKNWPPLGSVSGNSYGVTATFNADGSLASTNDQALQDAITAIKNLNTAGIKTYVIGLGAGVNNSANPQAAATLQAMAVAGGTVNFYAATDANSLNTAFLSIVDLIYKQSSIAAPIAPITVKSGAAFEYSLTTDPTPAAGYVRAFPVSAAGLPGSQYSWDAAALMTASNRATDLYSSSASGAMQLLNTWPSTDAAAFNLTATTCIPTYATIVSYTINPSYSNGNSSCNFLGTRLSNWFLGTFSTQSVGRYAGPPSTSALNNATGYQAFATAEKSRPAMLMFTNNDGFLYAVNAQTGALIWGWMPRSLLPQLQNYSTFQSLDLMDGNFAIVDAQNASGVWSTYVIGSAKSGGEHFSLQLTSAGLLSQVGYDVAVSGGTSPGDLAGATGAVPLHQTPQTVYLSGNTYAVFVVNSGTTSTLYEVNVGTNTVTSGTLPFTSSSALSVESQYNRAWLGSTAGAVWVGSLTGNATTDATYFNNLFTVLNPATNSGALSPLLYVTYSENLGLPYVVATSGTTMTVYTLLQAGWTPLWAASPTAGYLYSTSTNRYAVSTAVTTLTSTGVISDEPRIDGATVTLPIYVAPTSACGGGTGYYDFFNLLNGAFPTNSKYIYNGATLTADVAIGSGPAYTPSVTVTSQGIALNPGTAGNLTPQSPLVAPTRPLSPIGWRQN
ncbi:MAG: hypothetical protein JO370_00420 [Paucibacter sp.]|nr:hypothetical protein [Roseateles sp.]